MLYNSIRESPDYPKGFTQRQNGKTQNKINSIIGDVTSKRAGQMEKNLF